MRVEINITDEDAELLQPFGSNAAEAIHNLIQRERIAAQLRAGIASPATPWTDCDTEELRDTVTKLRRADQS